MANTFKFGNGNWAVKDGYALAYNDENNNFKPLPFDFTRASSATTLNRQGLIETVPSGKPRIDFLNNTSGHLLLEPSRTNLITYSEDFTQSVWTKNNVTIDANSTTSPYGTSTASTLENGTGNKRLQFTLSTSTSSTYNVSIFFKAKDTSTEGSIIAYNSSFTPLSYAEYDVENGTIGTSSGTSSIENYGNGWYRCILEFTATTTTSYIRYRVGNYLTGDDNKDIFIFGSQVELGSYATSYIPTEGSSVTRSAETNYQQNATKVIGQSEGTMYIEFVPKDTSATQILYQVRSSSGTVGQIDIRLTSGNISTLANDGGSSQFSMGSTSYSAGTTYKVALRYKLNDSKIYINGLSVGSDTSCSFTGSSLDQISFGENLTSLVPVADILDARLYNTALSDSQLQALTS